MNCPQCQFENRGGAKFCVRCGARLEILCQNCSHLNPPGSSYCEECGAALTRSFETPPTDALFIEKLDKLQRYLPQGLTQKILAHRDKIEGELKNVTVMFCDMEGFTPVVEKLGSEKSYDLMDRIYEILIHKVHHYGGTVNEMTGDGIMALFGAPIALEDAPQRAIRSAMSIHRSMVEFSHKSDQQDGLPPLRMRIGIHTGPVVVGTLGNNLRVEFKAVGDTVNLSARMQRLAEPGTTFVTEETFKLTEGFFRFEALGERIVKGKNGTIKAYRVIAASKSRTRFDVSAERGLSPFIGRDRELELLLDGFERSKKGRGQAFSIIAEAGVGKSRLLYEFRKAVTNESITFLEGRGLSYSQGVFCHPVIDVFKQSFNIRDGDSDAEIMVKVSDGLKALASTENTTLSCVLELLSVQSKEFGRPPLSPEARKNRIIQLFIRLVQNGSKIRPLVMAFEDLHWIDEGSKEILKATLDSISGARVILIFTYRPEFVHTWGGKSYHNQLNLNRLSNRESLSLAAYLLDGSKIDENLEKLIIEKTEGIPFYIEELVRFLKHNEIIRKNNNTYCLIKATEDLPIPASIHDVIMARVDSLPDGAKALLQTGSVAGREFSHDLIRMVSGTSDEELWSHLSALKDAELLYERGVYPQSIYVFKHALTREVAYHCLLHKKRKEIHKNAGRALEQIYAQRTTEACEILAFHFLNGEQWDLAYKYCFEAAVKSFSHSSYEEAKRYVEDALQALRKLPRDKTRIEQEIDLRFFMRSVLVPLGRHDEWGEWIVAAEMLASEIGDDARMSSVLNYLSSLHWIHGRPRKALEFGQQALTLATKVDHFSNQATIMFHLGLFFFTIGDYTKHVEYHQEVRNRLTGEAAYLQHGLSSIPGAWVRSHLCFGKAELGLFDGIDELAEEAIKIAGEVENALTLAIIHTFIGMAFLRFGKIEAGLEHAEKGYKVCIDSKVRFFHSFSAGALGYAYLLNNQPAQALSILKEGTMPDHLDRGVWTTHSLTVLAEAYRCVRQDQLAFQTISKALKLSSESEERGFESWAMVAMARINADAGRLLEARQWYQGALKQGADLSMQPLVAHCYKGLGDVNRRLGEQNEAQSSVATAKAMYRSMKMESHYF